MANRIFDGGGWERMIKDMCRIHNMINLRDKNVLVTGSSSMIGKAVIDALNKRGAKISSCQSSYYNLLSYSDTQQMFADIRPEYVIHCAGWNGNIQFNLQYPADIFYRTAKMALNVLTLCPEFGVKKVVSVISSCALPDKGEEILKAENLWEGRPNSTVECHGASKRILDVYSRMLNKQFGLNAVTAILTNCYGPYDSFNISKTKVAAGLIRRFVEAKQQNLPEVVCWGSGAPKRELMYSVDAGEALVQTLESYEDGSVPLCIGTGQDITIKELAEGIARAVGYEGEIKWDTTKTDGQMRKLLDSTKMREILNVPITPFAFAINDTVEWYRTNKESADKKI